MKPKVLVLGTHHMNPTEDMVQENGELLPNREQEILEVIEKLKRFEPTKVAVEVEVKYQDKLDEQYNQYLNESFKLPTSEIFQIGFRLAKEMNHKKVHAIDWMEILPGQRAFGAVVEWAKEHQPELYEFYSEFLRKNTNHPREGLTLIEMFRNFNDPNNIKLSHQGYMHFARIGYKENYVAMDWLRWWYQRNLIIYTNLARLVEHENDRIFLVIGFDHLYTVNQFLEESGMFDVEYAHKYL